MDAPPIALLVTAAALAAIYAFIVWSERWLRRRILRYLRWQYPNWVVIHDVVVAMDCTRAAATTALRKLCAEGRIVSEGFQYRATGLSTINPREDCL